MHQLVLYQTGACPALKDTLNLAWALNEKTSYQNEKVETVQ